MAKVVPPAPRARLTESGEALRVVISARRNWLALAFLSVWLFCWAFAEINALILLVSGKAVGTALLFVIAWLTIWTLGGAMALFYWWWNVAGREEIIVNRSGDLSIRYAIYGASKTWDFEHRSLRNVRFDGDMTPSWSQRSFIGMGGMNQIGVWNGPLAFDYGAKTYHFGAGIDEAEARDLLPHLLRRLSPDDPARET